MRRVRCNDLSNFQVRAALGFLNTNWKQSANNTWYGSFDHPYAMWAIYVGQAFSFDAQQSGNVEIPDTPSLNPANVTIEAWVRPDFLWWG
jgi:hypothetical protein